MTLMFAGHDTTTSTVSFMFYELARHPEIVARLRAEQERELSGGAPERRSSSSRVSCRSSRWCSRRRCASTRPPGSGRAARSSAFEFEGHTVPARAFVNYCSWASHHLPDVFPEPEEFRPERFAPQAREALPKGAYVPFGGGSRTCIGMRFGQLEVRTIATLILARVSSRCPTDFELSIRQMPTISPRDGLPMRVARRGRRATREQLPAAARRRLSAGSRDPQPVAQRLRAASALAPTPSHVHVRVGEQRQLQARRAAGPWFGDELALRWRAPRASSEAPRPNSPPSTRTSTSPPSLRRSSTPTPGGSAAPRRAALERVAPASCDALLAEAHVA